MAAELWTNICTVPVMPESPIFIDTGYLVALLNRRDGLHAQALALAKRWEHNKLAMLTTDAVLIELANFFARSPLRGVAYATNQKLRVARGWTVEPLETKLVTRAERRYGAHLDKEWSLTDCISIEVMTDHGATEAATADKHFTQAGFRVLMR
jgi:predicted nucleic acid-binding protein